MRECYFGLQIREAWCSSICQVDVYRNHAEKSNHIVLEKAVFCHKNSAQTQKWQRTIKNTRGERT